jgi:hypothetical protein
MNLAQQKALKQAYYLEAIRYMQNAGETLKKAGKDGRFYKDDKYVKTACGIAYNAVLKALDGYFKIKEINLPRGKKSIEYYRDNLAKIDRKLMNYLNNAYEILHISGYYEGLTSVAPIKEGFELAYYIIEKIKPE